jgi:RHS repeat-associated protein
VARFDYLPWGEQYTPSVSGARGDRQYNGRVYDAATGFHDYGARMYWPDIGRFISTDPAAAELTRPVTVNRYSYVLNNSYRYIDPTGEETQLAYGLNTATNMFGHIALIINSRVYSYGTNYTGIGSDWGASSSAYLSAQSAIRETRPLKLNIDSASEAALQNFLDTHNPNAPGAAKYDVSANSCVTVTERALEASGILPTHIALPNAEEPPGLRWVRSLTPNDLAYKAGVAGITSQATTVGTSGGSPLKAAVGTLEQASERSSP